MADAKTTTKDLQSEVDRLTQLLEDNGIDTAPRDANYGVVGNLADLQRLGALAVAEGKTNVEDAVVRPATTDPETGDTLPAETAAGNPPPGAD